MSRYVLKNVMFCLALIVIIVNIMRAQNDRIKKKKAQSQGLVSSIVSGKSKKQELDETMIYIHNFCKPIAIIASFAILEMIFKSNDQ